jgi:hypothetical protein
MLLSADWTLRFLTILVEAFVVYLFVIQGLFRKFLFFNCYLLLLVAAGVVRCVHFSGYGIALARYVYFYYFADAMLTLFLFLSVCELSARLIGTKMPVRRVVVLSEAALLATVWSSFAAVWSSGSDLTIHFAAELSRNIFLVCILTIILLWVWKLRNGPEDWIAVRFVNVLSIYLLLLFMVLYGPFHGAPRFPAIQNLSLMVGAWLPLGCGFALVSCKQPRKTITPG